jgi:DNA-binding transcriptional LysR family regulator
MLLNQIELFVTVAKHQNLGKTAQEMHVSASSVCQRLKSLENDLGVKLYKKNREGIELTEAGETLLATASKVLSQLDNLKRTLNSDSQSAVPSLSVGGTSSPSAKYLPAAITAFQKTHPDIKVTFLTSKRANIEKLLRASQLEIAIIQSPSESSDFNLEHFAADNLTFFTHPTYPLAKKKKLDLAELSKIPLIIREGKGASHGMLNQLKRQGLTLNVTMRCKSPDVLKAAVRRKMGVGVLFYNQIEKNIKRRDFKALNFSRLPKLVGNSYIVYSKTKPLSSVAGEFLTLLRSRKVREKIRGFHSNKNSPNRAATNNKGFQGRGEGLRTKPNSDASRKSTGKYVSSAVDV